MGLFAMLSDNFLINQPPYVCGGLRLICFVFVAAAVLALLHKQWACQKKDLKFKYLFLLDKNLISGSERTG
ncbi:hypothetical protein [Desulfatibacillum aliphaticivorans]|uniref:hypothetical protein n=1 Tax=Desulfatibacillum aliphaticivorans TaxID=218208 RepID=UPI00040ACA5A|nr:hypothetical protein [Desulfatibacillum aliphaticivorans]